MLNQYLHNINCFLKKTQKKPAICTHTIAYCIDYTSLLYMKLWTHSSAYVQTSFGLEEVLEPRALHVMPPS